MEKRDLEIGDYIIMQEVLGAGAFATCKKAYLKSDPQVLRAVKIISKLKLKEQQFPTEHVNRIVKEIESQKCLNSEEIVKMYDVLQSDHNIYVFLEYCNGGDLADFLKNKNGILAESEVLHILNSLKAALEEMYQHKCIHRDLKPQNILLHNGQIKLADFGFAKTVEDMNLVECQTWLGTPLYNSIELLTHQPYSSKCDIFALGIIIYELLFGIHPFYHKKQITGGQEEMAKILKNSQVQFSFSQIVIQNQVFLDLLKSFYLFISKQLFLEMLQIYEKDRISWENFFEHQFFQEQKEQSDQYQFTLNNTMDSLERSLLQTKNYLEKNLVQGKISLVQGKLNSINRQMKADEQLELSKISQNEIQKKAEEINTYFSFERNIAIFFSELLRQFFSQISSSQLKLPRERLYKLMFLFSKFSIVYLQKVNNGLNSDQPMEGFKDQLILKYYKTLPFFAQIQQLIKIDLLNLNEFFNKLYPKLQDILKTKPDLEFYEVLKISELNFLDLQQQF